MSGPDLTPAAIRWDVYLSGPPRTADNGAWVRADDHDMTVAALSAALATERARAEAADAKAATAWNDALNAAWGQSDGCGYVSAEAIRALKEPRKEST